MLFTWLYTCLDSMSLNGIRAEMFAFRKRQNRHSDVYLYGLTTGGSVGSIFIILYVLISLRVA